MDYPRPGFAKFTKKSFFFDAGAFGRYGAVVGKLDRQVDSSTWVAVPQLFLGINLPGKVRHPLADNGP